ncbi:MAG: putative toxin-antitoxin system toxin component, PIN family [Burkholderiales bacterium]|nr:putative toxin-antitoxin system toxin component, PIN family [Burkholderiales bacterium]
MRVAERRLVLDTNTLVSRLLLPQGTAGRAVDKALAEGAGVVRIIPITHRIQVCRDPKTTGCRTALNGEAQTLVTGDKDLLVLADHFGPSHGLQILTPGDYLNVNPH